MGARRFKSLFALSKMLIVNKQKPRGAHHEVFVYEILHDHLFFRLLGLNKNLNK